jgi:hypothetical protein
MEVSAIYRKAALVVVVALVGLVFPLVAGAQEYSVTPATGGWQYDTTWGWQYYDATGSIVDHPYAIDSCRVLDVPDESFHAGSSYWFPVEGDGMERVYSYGCWL